MKNMDKTNILVTGGAGFIGSYIVPRLLKEGMTVIVLDNLSTGKLSNLRGCLDNAKFRFINADIRDRAALGRACDGVDFVVHLAALIDVAASVANPALTYEVNVTGTLNLLQASVRSKVKRFVLASSTAVYGDCKELPVKETANLQPLSPYAASKATAEAYCRAFKERYGLNTVSLRFFNVFGSGNENNPYSGVITKFLRNAVTGEKLTIYGDGEQTRDFIHVSDIADAVFSTLNNDKLHSDRFNICTGIPTSINQLVDSLKAVTNKDLAVTYRPPRQGEIRYSYGDTTKAVEELGFRSKVGLIEGLNLMYNSLAEQIVA